MSDEQLKKWYCLRVISGKERKLKERIDLEIKRNNWEHIVLQTVVPTRKEYKIRNGKKVITEKNLMPGYILVEAVDGQLNGEMVKTIADVTNVIHFLGKENPTPLRKTEVHRILGTVDESIEAGEQLAEPFIINESVKIIDGPFNDFIGTIQEVNEEKKKLKVIVKIFGRGTEVELNFMQVEKQQ
jgi:transcriptional antiterminator NusG